MNTEVFGIDLGTTNSVIVHLVGGIPKAIPIDGSPIVPSIVRYENGAPIVGLKARNLELENPMDTVRSIKRQMGKNVVLDVGGQKRAPEEISADILQALKTGAEASLGTAVKDVVITVPAYFDDAQRRATLRAGEIAGLNVLRLLNEPTSASLVYDKAGSLENLGVPQHILVYDLGGGTFDVSVLEIFDSIREVKATAGNSRLGGDDFDEILVRHLVDSLKARGVNPANDSRAMARLRRLAEETKITLSQQIEVPVRAEFLAEFEGEPVHLHLTVTRHQFQEWIRPLLQSTVDLCKRAIADAKLTHESISQICLVGGSTRIPLVRELLESELKIPTHEEVDVDLAVGQGASIQAGILAGVPVERILVDVASHSLGVKVIGDFDLDDADTFSAIIKRHTALPARRMNEYATTHDNQEKVGVEVFQGENRRCSKNTRIGSFDYVLKPAPAHTSVGCEFQYDLNGIVTITVTQQGHAPKTVALNVAEANVPQRIAIGSDSLSRKLSALLETESLSPADDREVRGWLAQLASGDAEQRKKAEEDALDFLTDL